jgi:aspartyl/glutamyl-tRNA(Asn/Gln) amidotransferase C subunit
MLSERELDHLQKLACIKLNPKEKKKLWEQLINIIDFLDQLNKIKIDQKEINNLKLNNSLRVLSWIKKYDNVGDLLENVNHNKTNKNIVIKSVLL